MMAVAVAALPRDFEGGERSADGGPWELFGERYWINPKLSVESWAFDMILLWRMAQSGMGVGHLPEAGGTMDQSPVMLDAFNIMSGAEAELKSRKPE